MMLCQICKANPATIHIQEIVNGQTNTLHICPECAKKLLSPGPSEFAGI